jgi:hypothetical protein
MHQLGPGIKPVLKKGERTIKGAVVPHAGYMYSGPVAAHVYAEIAADGFPDIFVILGPNHTGLGSGIALCTETYRTPLGDVDVDKELAKKLAGKLIEDDSAAHMHEHSIEVQLPFLQYLKKEIKFIPVCMSIQDYETSKEVGTLIAKHIAGKDAIILASTDFSHYVPQATAFKLDKMAIDCILKLDSKALYNTVVKHNISMCGYGPVIAMLCAVSILGGKKASLLKYATSGDVAPMRDVVGYAAITVR